MMSTSKLLPFALAALAATLVPSGPAPRAADGGGTPISPAPPVPWHSIDASGGINDDGSYASLAYRRIFCGLYQTCPRTYISHQRKNVGLALSTSSDLGDSFSTQIIDDGDGDQVGAYTDIAAGTLSGVFISYQNQTLIKAKFAHYVGSGGNCGAGAWKCQHVANGGKFSSITVDNDERVSIVHVGNGLRHSWADPPYTSFTTEDVTGGTITSADSAVDTLDQLHVVYTSGQCLKYKYWFGSGWSDTETVFCAPENPTGDTGRVSVAVNYSSRPHVAFITNTASGSYELKHAYKTDYYNWAVEHVTFLSGPQAGTSIVLDTDNIDTAAISYGTNTSSGYKLVLVYPNNLYGWDGVAIDNPGGAYSSMRRIADKLSIAHYDPVGHDLRFSEHD
jgi:hypothetical protein